MNFLEAPAIAWEASGNNWVARTHYKASIAFQALQNPAPAGAPLNLQNVPIVAVRSA